MDCIKIIKGFILSCMIIFSSAAMSQTMTDTSDLGITAAVNNKLAANAALTGGNIQVTTTNGIVHLTGNLNSETQATTATEIAQSTPGVKDVDVSNLQIKGSSQPLTDALITAKIKGLFLQQKLFGNKDIAAMTIKVETNNGQVLLSGTADNNNQIDTAIKLAQSISGVKNVKSTVQISGTTTTTY
jgi:hyperosmotically inducible periplasmic protein